MASGVSQDTTRGMGINSANVAVAQLTRVNGTRVGNGVVRIGSVSKLLGRGAPVIIGQVASKVVFIRGLGSWCSLGVGRGCRYQACMSSCLLSDKECCLPNSFLSLYAFFPVTVDRDVEDWCLFNAAFSSTCPWYSTVRRHAKCS